MKQALSIFRFLRDCTARGERAALVTLTGVTGSAARAPGEHMAVAESGVAVGSFSGGCVEAAVIAEAQDVLASGHGRLVRFGAGSRYIDIRLPCGGGIDLLFSPDPDPAQVGRVIALLESRRPVRLLLEEAGEIAVDRAAAATATGWENTAFQVRHDPMLRMVVLGHGAEPGALLGMAAAYGADSLLLSPQAELVDDARRQGIAAERLRTLGASPYLVVDPWTAVVTLFHDHDWETELLLQALDQQPFFIGAMGSRKTHAERRDRLLQAGGRPEAINRIVGPIGLIAASRDPQTLALSIMAQVAQRYDELLSRPSALAQHGSATMNSSHCAVECACLDELRVETLQS